MRPLLSTSTDSSSPDVFSLVTELEPFLVSSLSVRPRLLFDSSLLVVSSTRSSLPLPSSPYRPSRGFPSPSSSSRYRFFPGMCHSREFILPSARARFVFPLSRADRLCSLTLSFPGYLPLQRRQRWNEELHRRHHLEDSHRHSVSSSDLSIRPLHLRRSNLTRSILFFLPSSSGSFGAACSSSVSPSLPNLPPTSATRESTTRPRRLSLDCEDFPSIPPRLRRLSRPSRLGNSLTPSSETPPTGSCSR